MMLFFFFLMLSYKKFKKERNCWQSKYPLLRIFHGDFVHELQPQFSLCNNIMKLQTYVVFAWLLYTGRLACLVQTSLTSVRDLWLWGWLRTTLCTSLLWEWNKLGFYVCLRQREGKLGKAFWQIMVLLCCWKWLLILSTHSRYAMEILVIVFETEDFASCCYSSYIRFLRDCSKHVALNFDYKGNVRFNFSSRRSREEIVLAIKK